MRKDLYMDKYGFILGSDCKDFSKFIVVKLRV